MLVIGKKEQIQELTNKIQKEFSVKIQHNLADYLDCEFHMNKVKNKRMAWTTLYNKEFRSKIWRESNEGKIVSDTWDSKITTGRRENPEDKISPEDHESYRRGVGTLLYLTKHSKPDICNTVRELSKTMDAPTPVHLKEMYKVLRLGEG